ncbi:hypothetical protein F511_19158 [Dorcoceras hygrometricum]|uniref:Uncharacterized protein n=1 Tax=Dorcoceras hygrometricum TaxID=472368 RepID=A0A2Z7AEQ6_9LAMI|nr:hypothetical protein F511_19158 [Dorcoceras hygrometricum]
MSGHAKQFKRRSIKNTSPSLPTADQKRCTQNDAFQLIKTTSSHINDWFLKPTADYGRYRQSGPRPEPRLLRQPALEALTNSARTDSTRRVGQKQLSGERSGGGGGDDRRRRQRRSAAAAAAAAYERKGRRPTSTRVRVLRIQLAVGPQPLWLRNHNSRPAQRIMYGPFNPYIPIRSTTIGKSRVAIDPIAMHTSWRSNSDIASVTSIGYPRMSASGESSTTMHRLLHASGSHPIPTPYDPNCTVDDRQRAVADRKRAGCNKLSPIEKIWTFNLVQQTISKMIHLRAKISIEETSSEQLSAQERSVRFTDYPRAISTEKRTDQLRA